MCNVELLLEDRYDVNNALTLGNSDLDISSNNVTLMADQLKTNRIYNFTYEANAGGPEISNYTLSND